MILSRYVQKQPFFSPEQDDDAVKHVESVTDVPEESVGHQLEQHLDGKDDGEGQIADLNSLGQKLGLEKRRGRKKTSKVRQVRN